MKKDIKQLFDEFIKGVEYSTRLRPATLRGYKNAFSLFSKLMPEVSTTELLTTEMLGEFFKRIDTRPRTVGKGEIRTGVKKSTIKTHYSKLNVFFVWLLKKDYIDKNPLKEIKSPSVTYDDFRRLTDDSVRRIYSAITLHSNNSFLLRRDTMIVSIFLFCGLRLGELASLKVTDVDIAKGRIIVNGETSKSKYTRTLGMHPTLILHIKDYLKERNARRLKTVCLIASNRGDRGITPEGLKHWVKGLIKKSGVKFHPHEFRHTYACKLAEADVDAFKIQKLMGHNSIMMTMKYVRSMKTEDMDKDVEKISFS